MRRDPAPSDGEENPLDAALGDLQDLAELEQRFARLDARLDAVHRREDVFDTDSDPDDPFIDVARALRDHRSQSASDDSQSEPAGIADEHEDDHSVDERDERSDEIEERCQDALDALEAGDLIEARELALEAVRMDDEHPFPMFVLGLVAEQEDDLDTARDMAELSLRTAGTNPDAIGLRAHIHVRQHELAEAEDLLRYGIAHNPDDATLHEGLARVVLARGEHREALRAANAALRIEPGNPGAMAVRTAALDASGDRGALLAALRQSVQLHPEDPYGMVELASIEMEYGNLERARVLLARAQRLAPRDPEITDVRRLVEHVHEQPLLRPVPALLRWLRDFPGGMPGFLMGYVIAALPLHALAMSTPQYRVPAIAIIVGWGVVALYAWIAPVVLTHRLNKRAARAAALRLTDELQDPLAPVPALERLFDVCAMLVTAQEHRRAADLLERAGERARSQSFDQIVGWLRSPRVRVRRAALHLPGTARALAAIAVIVAVGAPALTESSSLPMAVWHGVAVVAIVLAWMLGRLQRSVARRADAAFATAHAAIAAAVIDDD